MIGKLTENSQLKGNLSVGGGTSIEYEAGIGIDITDNVISNTITSYNDLTDTPELSSVATSGSYNDLIDKPTIPQELTTNVYHDTFSYKENDYTIDYATYGNLVDLEINSGTSNGYANATNYLLYTLPESIRPAFEVCVPIMSYGYLSGVSWINTDGEVYIRFSSGGSIFRLHIAYLVE